jgi:riboflavin synthase
LQIGKNVAVVVGIGDACACAAQVINEQGIEQFIVFTQAGPEKACA